MTNRLDTISRLFADVDRADRYPLNIYRPSPLQQPFHEAGCTEILVWGGKVHQGEDASLRLSPCGERARTRYCAKARTPSLH